MRFFPLWLSALAAFAGPDMPLSYTDTTSARALQNMATIGARDPAKLSESEKGEWVRSRFAWVALLRLQGKVPEAEDVFAGCGVYCAKFGPSAEWEALRKWGCARRKKAPVCAGK